MAKSEEEIYRQIQQSIESSDNTLDVWQGPIPNVFITPQSGQLVNASNEAELLRALFTLNFDTSITDDEVKTALSNYGSSPGLGMKSKHIQYFMRFTRLTSNVTIPAGTLVGNNDGSLVYRVLNTGTMYYASPAAYYNSSRNAYEIGLQVEAIGTGVSYELPPGRVNTMLTSTQGIDSTENRTQSLGGKESETKDSQIARLKTALLGINLGAAGGIEKRITDSYQELVSDVSVIEPYQKEFARIVDKPSLDVYIIANEQSSYSQQFIASTGQTQVILTKKPALSLSSLTINNTVNPIGYTPALNVDKSKETGYSMRSQDTVDLDVALVGGDEVVVTYLYNSALETVNTNVFGSTERNLFNTDILIRYPFVVNPVISGIIKVLPSYSVSEVESNVKSFLEGVFTFTTFTSIVYPEDIRDRIKSEVSGIQSFKLTEFHRSTNSYAQIEPMVFNSNEISVYDSSQINLKVVG